MRRFAAALVASMLMTVLWGAAPGRTAPRYGPSETVVVALDSSDAVSLDPQMAYELGSILPVHQMYSNLVQFQTGDITQVRPQVAESWEVSSDARKYTFHLRGGIKFSSGNTLTADDVVYMFERVVNLPKDPASWLITQTGIDSKNVDDAVRALDPQTVVITLPKPFSPGAFLSILANTVGGIADSKTVKEHVQSGDWGNTWLNEHSAGSGPYQLVRWERLVVIEVVANPNYNLGPAPQIKRIVWPNIMENTLQREMLGRGEADVAWDLSAAQIAVVKRDPRFYIVQVPNLGEEYLGMDVKNVPAFGKVEVRRAVKYALDYEGIIRDLLAGNAIPLQGIVPKGLFGYDPGLPFTHDAAKARSLLQEAGFGGGFTVDMLAGTGTAFGGISAGDLASKIKNDLAAVGITVNIRQVASDELFKTYRAQKSQMVLAYWFVDYPDPDDFAKPFGDFTQKSLTWRLQYSNEEMTKLVDQAAGLQNTPQRAALYKRINDMVAQDGPFAILYQAMLSLTVSKRLQHMVFDPVNFIDFTVLTKQ